MKRSLSAAGLKSTVARVPSEMFFSLLRHLAVRDIENDERLVANKAHTGLRRRRACQHEGRKAASRHDLPKFHICTPMIWHDLKFASWPFTGHAFRKSGISPCLCRARFSKYASATYPLPMAARFGCSRDIFFFGALFFVPALV
jgi:hypothetical protein